jgi:hypothetical protein
VCVGTYANAVVVENAHDTLCSQLHSWLGVFEPSMDQAINQYPNDRLRIMVRAVETHALVCSVLDLSEFVKVLGIVFIDLHPICTGVQLVCIAGENWEFE